ncbi:hypothetical protein JTE90_016163 [Oedothorax gibbosus]|uniref:Uncharacterized protein n=1 Tax=Oedothorax gibbosus TaxID=931172 RepID=A0AAV6URG6_9ARAC|nr:hypothetical protein JTE90_016163 [Oedothorax gibbosus]
MQVPARANAKKSAPIPQNPEFLLFQLISNSFRMISDIQLAIFANSRLTANSIYTARSTMNKEPDRICFLYIFSHVNVNHSFYVNKYFF